MKKFERENVSFVKLTTGTDCVFIEVICLNNSIVVSVPAKVTENGSVFMVINKLAEMMEIKDSSMSVRLMKLEKMSYITRVIDENNLKKKRVYITTIGKSICGQCRRFKREYEEMLLKGFTKKEKQQLKLFLEKIRKNTQSKMN